MWIAGRRMAAPSPFGTLAPMAVGSSNSFDLVVLGAGTGGYSAAFRAGQLGLKVALVDEGKIGGTCLHSGCIPTKAMLEAADFYERMATRRTSGSSSTGRQASTTRPIADRRQAVVDRLTKGLMSLVKKNKVEFIRGPRHAPGRQEGQALQARRGRQAGRRASCIEGTDVILATGSRVKSLPGLEPDGEHILTSDDILQAARCRRA